MPRDLHYKSRGSDVKEGTARFSPSDSKQARVGQASSLSGFGSESQLNAEAELVDTGVYI
jgi:hypothetical protein